MAAGNWRIYDQFLLDLARGNQKWFSHSYSVALLSTNLFDSTDSVYGDIQADDLLTGNGYTVQGQGVSTTSALDGVSDVIFKASQAQWIVSGTLAAKAAVIYGTDTSLLVAYVWLNDGADYTKTDGELFTVDSDVNGVFKLTRP